MLRDFIVHVAARVLANDFTSLEILYSYFVLGMSPREIARAFGVPFGRVKTVTKTAVLRAGRSWVGEAVFKVLYDHLRSYEPIIQRRGDTYYCTICRRTVKKPRVHIYGRHKDLLNTIADELTRKIVLPVR